jgi:uncharacterized FlaG/YvyC family protein
MDIKNVRNILPQGIIAPAEVKSRAKTDATSDRDGNGQSAGEEQKKRQHLTPEEIDEAIKKLSALPGVKDNGLIVRLESHDGIIVVYIEDREGKIVRRIPEADLGLLNFNSDKRSGHLLNRTG